MESASLFYYLDHFLESVAEGVAGPAAEEDDSGWIVSW